MKLDALTDMDVLNVMEWRNKERKFLRTPYFITEDMQLEFYNTVISNRNSPHRYYAIVDSIDPIYEDDEDRILVGMGGLTNIDYINSHAEISLILEPGHRGRGLGLESVKLLIEEGKGNIGLKTIWGEVYNCGNVAFWERVVAEFNGYKTKLPNRKLWQGHYYDSMWFCV